MGLRWIGRSVHSVMVLLATRAWAETRRKCACLCSCEHSQTYKLSNNKNIMHLIFNHFTR